MKARKVSETYSLDRCIVHVDKAIDTASGGGLDKFSERDLRKYMRDLASEMKSIEGRLHPDAAPVLEAGLAYLGQISDRIEALKKAESKVDDKKDAKVPERDELEYQEAKKAYNEAVAAAKAKLK